MAELLTIKEVAEGLGVTYITALRYVRSGKMRGVRLGGQWRVARAELERFAAEGNLDSSEERRTKNDRTIAGPTEVHEEPMEARTPLGDFRNSSAGS